MNKAHDLNRLQPLLISSLMVLVMSGVLSLYWTSMGVTVPGSWALLEFLWGWLNAWAESFIIALPTSLIVAPVIRKWVTHKGMGNVKVAPRANSSKSIKTSARLSNC